MAEIGGLPVFACPKCGGATFAVGAKHGNLGLFCANGECSFAWYFHILGRIPGAKDLDATPGTKESVATTAGGIVGKPGLLR